MEQQQFIETRVSHTRYLHPIICDANAYLHSQKDNTNYSEGERVTYNLVKQIFMEWSSLRASSLSGWVGEQAFFRGGWAGEERERELAIMSRKFQFRPQYPPHYLSV